MDLLHVAINIFKVIFNLCLKINNFFYPVPELLFVFDNNNLYTRGYIGSEKKRIRIDHFNIEGDYTIKINNDYIRSIKNIKTDGFDFQKTYFLISNNFFSDIDSSIEIIDNILDNKKIFKISKNTPINFINLINDMDN